MVRAWLSRLPPYGLALLVTALALLVRYPLWPVLGNSIPFLTFLPAVLVAAARGGLGPGLFATLLGGVAAERFLVAAPPHDGGAAAEAVGFLLFALIGAALSGLSENLRQTRARLEAEARRLEEAEARHRLALEGITDAFAQLDRDWRYVYVNARAAEISGLRAADMLGKTLWELFPAVRGTAMEEQCRRAVAEQRPALFEYYFPPFGRWFEQRLYPSAGGLAIFSADVTERKRAEAERARVAAILEATPDFVATARADGVATYHNRQARRLLGLPETGYPAEWPITRSHPEWAARLLRDEALPAALRDGAWRGETALRTHDGREIPLDQVIIRHDAGDGQPPFVSTIARDVSDRHLADAKLRQSEARFRQLAEALPQIVWTAAPDGTITFINRHWTEYTGLTLEQTNRLDEVRAAIHPDDAEPVFRAWAAALAGGRPHEVQWRFRRHRDGVYRWFLTRAVPVRDEAGRITEWFGTATDIDAQKRAEEALREADRRKDEFLAMLAHELRNPLAPIRNALQILRLPGAAPDVQERARQLADRQVGHVARLIDDLLDVSRVTRGKIRLKPEAVDLAAAVARAVEAARPTAQARRHELTVALPPGPVPLTADPARLEQVFVNLLTNAAKYTPPGGRIAVTLEAGPTAAVVRVCDNGVGIGPDLLPRVFDLFVQGEQGPDRTQGGLGIGLTLVKALVEMHGGTVTAHSAGPGQGSEFVVRLPCAAPGPARPEPAPEPAAPPGPGRRVLVVDDNRDAAESLALLLQLQGHEVRTAHDGAAALAAGAAFRPEVVFLDIGLPGMDGYEVARRYRATEDGFRTLLVAVTGYGQEEDRRRAAAAGFDHHLVKPPDPTAVARLVAAPADDGAPGTDVPGGRPPGETAGD